MTRAEILFSLGESMTLALTAWAEGRGDWRQGNSSVEERIAIMSVVRNRVASWRRWKAAGPTYKAVCLARKQFSCWNEGTDRNHRALMTLAQRVVTGQASADPIYDETLFLAQGIISGVILDRTGGATSYYAPKAMQPHGRVPSWARNQPALDIGDQKFLVV